MFDYFEMLNIDFIQVYIEY